MKVRHGDEVSGDVAASSRRRLRPIGALLAGGAGSDVRWGLVDQLFSSGTNFALFLLAGRWLGARDLGIVAIGFSAYLLVLGFQRALVTDPSVVFAAGQPADERRTTTVRSLTVVLVYASLAGGVMAVVGWIVGGDVGRGLLYFAPWILPALVQDEWRFVLFRDQRGRSAAMNDGLWAACMVGAIPLANALEGLWPVVACWGIGATAGSIMGFVQTRCGPAKTRPAFEWWRRNVWIFGRWLMLESIVFAVGAQSVVFVMAGILGATDVGGFRAAMSLFAPMTLLGPALALPGLPAVSKALTNSLEAGKRRAAKLSVVAGVGALCYVVAVGSGGDRLLAFVFGDSFSDFAPLLLPIAAAQVVAGGVIGFYVLLKALQQGKAMVLIGVVTGGTSILAAAIGARADGILGAAWGLTVAGTIGSILTVVRALRAPHHSSPGSASPGEVRSAR